MYMSTRSQINQKLRRGGTELFQILVSFFPPVILSLPYPLARTTHLYIVHNIGTTISSSRGSSISSHLIPSHHNTKNPAPTQPNPTHSIPDYSAITTSHKKKKGREGRAALKTTRRAGTTTAQPSPAKNQKKKGCKTHNAPAPLDFGKRSLIEWQKDRPKRDRDNKQPGGGRWMDR